MKPTVIIYRDRLLYPSETFIREQAESMRRFTPYYVGARPTNGLKTPPERTLLIGDVGPTGRCKEILFKGLHLAPFLMPHLRRLRPQLVHAHFGLDAVEVMPLAAKLGVPLVATYHGHDVNVADAITAKHRRGRRYLRLRHQLRDFCGLNIVVSRSVERDLRARGFVDRNIFLHYIGVDVDKFRPDPAQLREDVVLFVGRLVEMKGCEFAIRAMAEVQQQHRGVRLVLIGDGVLRPELEQLARTLNCNAEFLGVQPPHMVWSWMNRARIFCTPSVSARSGNVETFGIVFIEAQSMELPVVSTTAGGIPEAVEDGVTGLLAPERDHRALAGHLHTLLSDNALCQRLSWAGRERVCRNFNLLTQTTILESKYEQLIERWLATGQRVPSLDDSLLASGAAA